MKRKNIPLNSKLKFKNQFIITPKPITNFPDWQHSELIGNNIFIYAHPSLNISTISNEKGNVKIVLLGYLIHPDFPDKTNDDLLYNLVIKTKSFDDFIENSIDFAGRFVLIVSINNRTFIINDAGGLRSVFYTIHEGEKYFATQPLIFNELFPLHKSDKYETFINSKHYKEDIEFWVPSGVSLYDNIYHLVPNHYIDVSNLEQVRYYPTKALKKLDIETGTQKSAEYLKKLLYAVSLRFKLTLPMTAGVDSRIIMAATKSFNKELFYYTLLDSRHDLGSYDIRIPKHMLKRIRRKHHIINCQAPADPEFLDFYKKNVDLAHEDWAKNLYGMFNEYPQGFVNLKGNVSEIGRCVCYPDGIHPEITSLNQINLYMDDFLKMPFIMEPLEKWFQEAKVVHEKTGFKILDLFYWEIRTGSWYAQSINETDMLSETFTPFNHRPLLETMMGVPGIYRQRDDSLMHKKIVEYFWPELLYWPINRRWNNRDKFKYYMAHKFKQIGVYNEAHKLYKTLHKNYMKLKGA